MLEEARKKIEDEMKTDELKPIGRYILDQLLTSEENAGKVMTAGKNLKACFDAVKSKARSHAHNGCAIIEDKTVYKWVRECFGIAGKPDEEKAPEAAPAALPATSAPKTINLLDLL